MSETIQYSRRQRHADTGSGKTSYKDVRFRVMPHRIKYLRAHRARQEWKCGQNYNGTGINIIAQCIDGSVRPEAFLLKIIFTACTLGAGYKGGEIVPSFFIGAAFGCLFGLAFGFSPTLCTAVGMTAVFCGVTNCPISSLLISFELFGYDGMPYFLLSVVSVVIIVDGEYFASTAAFILL